MELELEFDTDNPEFCRGVEIGIAFGLLKGIRPGEEFFITMHNSNVEMCMRLSEAYDLRCMSHELDDDFMQVFFWID